MGTKVLNKNHIDDKEKSSKNVTAISSIKSPELRSALVRVAHKLSSNNSNTQVVKIGDKYFRIKELG